MNNEKPDPGHAGGEEKKQRPPAVEGKNERDARAMKEANGDTRSPIPELAFCNTRGCERQIQSARNATGFRRRRSPINKEGTKKKRARLKV